MQDAARSCALLLKSGGAVIAGLTDADLARPSRPGGKTAGWLLGHICITGDFVRRKCGAVPMTPKEWGPRFTIGTTPSAERADYPPMAELRAAFESVYGDLVKIAPTLPPETLSALTPFEQRRDDFPTLGAFLTWIMTGHLGYHLGQLSEWMATRG